MFIFSLKFYKNLSKAQRLTLIISSVTILWLLSGTLIERKKPEELKINNKLISVVTENSHSQSKTLFLTLYGDTEADKTINIKSEINGKIITIDTKLGKKISNGDILATLASSEYANILERAKINLEKASSNLENKKLNNNFSSETTETLIQALENAKIRFEKAKSYSKNQQIRSPLSGFVENIHLEEGDNVKIGDQIITVIKTSKIIAKGYIPENYINNIDQEIDANVKVINLPMTKGKIKFIGKIARAETRDFEIEVEINNKDNSIVGGLTAEIQVPIKEVFAHKIARSTLSINDTGEVGVKYVDNQNIVHFLPVKILDDDENNIWIYGLGDELNIITTGHGFAKEGEKVITARNDV